MLTRSIILTVRSILLTRHNILTERIFEILLLTRHGILARGLLKIFFANTSLEHERAVWFKIFLKFFTKGVDNGVPQVLY